MYPIFMNKKRDDTNNYAFIDSQNVYRGVKDLGWKIDWRRFRVYLKEKYQVSKAYIFIGFIPKNYCLYKKLEKAGFILRFKPILFDDKGGVKGNIDADLVLQVMLELQNFDKAVIISSDGDFYSLVNYLYNKNKLEFVLSPCLSSCSKLLKKAAKNKILYMDNLVDKIGLFK